MPSGRWLPPSASKGRTECTSSNSTSATTERMNSSVTATEVLKLVSEPSRLAWMNSSTSG